MFKKGQLVRSLNTGCVYYIHEVHDNGLLNVGYVSSRGVARGGYTRPPKRLQLIGNNYKPKR